MEIRRSFRKISASIPIILFLLSNLTSGQSVPLQTRQRPLEKILNPDGTVNLEEGRNGRFDPRGFRMKYGIKGEPVFIPNGTKIPASIKTGEPYWDDQFYLDGINNTIWDMAISSAGDIYIGGYFTAINGNKNLKYVVKWDGNSWSALGSGVDALVYTLEIHGNDLYVGGRFTTAGGITVNHIAKWDGSSWSALDSGTDRDVFSIAISGGEIYVGGVFGTAGGISANNIAKWNGSSWSALGTGVDKAVYAIAISGSDIFAGGYFTMAGGDTVNRIAKWDGSAWSALGNGVNDEVWTIAIDGSDIYAGGEFTMAGSDTVNHIAKWNGSSWSALGEGANDWVETIAINGDDIYVGGYFTTVGGIETNAIAKWDGSGWSALGSGVNYAVKIITIIDSNVYVGGIFEKAGDLAASNIARWDGINWSSIGFELTGGNGLAYASISAIDINGHDLYAGGEFIRAGGISANYIAKWDGSSWSALGTGVNDGVYAIAISGSDVYVGGYFTIAGGISANYIAKWDGSSWSALGTGVNGPVRAIAISDGDVYVGGNFTTAGGISADYIAKWDGSSWSALGNGVNTYVRAIAISGSDIYAGGYFTTAGGSSANYIAKWNGSSWSALGNGVNECVREIAISDSNVYVGGDFTTAGSISANYIAKWNGSSWSALGTGVHNWVYAIAIRGSDIFLGGYFRKAGGISADFIAKWDGSNWEVLGGGTDGPVYTFKIDGNDLYVGGSFTTAGGIPSHGFGRYGIEALEPRAQPTDLKFSNVSFDSLTVSFTDPPFQPDGYFVIRQAGVQPTFTPIDGIPYIVGETVGDATVVHMGSSTSFNDTDLLGETLYYYSVFSYNGSGDYINYLTSTPLEGSQYTIASEPTAQPTNIKFTDVTQSSFTISFTEAAGSPDGYIAFRRIGTYPSSSPQDGTTYSIYQTVGDGILVYFGSSDFFTDSGLSANTDYYYEIYSYNGSSNLINYLLESPLAGNQWTRGDTDRPAISNITTNPDPAYLNSDITVSATITDESQLANVQLFYMRGDQNTFQDHVDMSVQSGIYYGIIPGSQVTEAGILFSIYAQNAQAGDSTYHGSCRITIPNGSVSTNNTTNSPYRSGFPEGIWRMISVPLDLDNKSVSSVLSSFGSPGDESWKLYEYPQNETSTSANFIMGKAFWLKHLLGESTQITLGSGITAGSDDGRIILSPGWNQIANPFTFAIDWSEDTDAGENPDIKGPIKYDGNQYLGIGQSDGNSTPFTNIDPWDGYFVYNAADTDQILTVNPIRSIVSAKITNKSTVQSALPQLLSSGWQINLSVSSDNYKDRYNYVGTVADASDFEDRYDLPELPVIGNYVSVYFDHETENGDLYPFTIDYKAPSEEGYQWTMHVRTNMNKQNNILKWIPNNLPENYDLALLDISNNRIIDIDKGEYQFQNRYELHPVEFKVFAGPREYVTKALEEVKNRLPEKFDLVQNYPNPFNPSSTIRFKLLHMSKVSLVIYNVLGENVITILRDQVYNTGVHEVSWDGTDQNGYPVSSGLYIYIIRADQFISSKKMILLR